MFLCPRISGDEIRKEKCSLSHSSSFSVNSLNLMNHIQYMRWFSGFNGRWGNGVTVHHSWWACIHRFSTSLLQCESFSLEAGFSLQQGTLIFCDYFTNHSIACRKKVAPLRNNTSTSSTGGNVFSLSTTGRGGGLTPSPSHNTSNHWPPVLSRGYSSDWSQVPSGEGNPSPRQGVSQVPSGGYPSCSWGWR